MGRRQKLTWFKARGCWKKKYRGKVYYLKYGSGKTDQTGYRQALAAWEEKHAQLDQQHYEALPLRREIENGIKKRQQMAEWYQANGEATEAARLGAEIDEIRSDPEHAADRLELDPLWGVPEAAQLVWADRLKRNAPLAPSTVGNDIAAFLKSKELQQGVGDLAVGRLDNLTRSLCFFRDRLGSAFSTERIDGKTLSDYHSQLLACVAGKQFSPAYAKDNFAAAKQFIKWCWENELLDNLPRSFHSNRLSFRIPLATIEVFENEEIHALLANASELTQLYILLMLNCGMTQKDISDLAPNEVDWGAGYIERKRSKTRNANGNVPTVAYKLWLPTLKLLKRFGRRKGDRVFLNENGQPLKTERIEDGKYKKSDNISSAYFRICRKLKITKPKPLKLLRKTSATRLDGFCRYASFYLGHAPRSVADKHYVRPSQEQFDKALYQLGESYGIV